jgi:hypothetical protein
VKPEWKIRENPMMTVRRVLVVVLVEVIMDLEVEVLGDLVLEAMIITMVILLF